MMRQDSAERLVKQFVILWGAVMLFSASAFAQDPNFHIYLCFGQSNMEGFPGIPEEETTGVDERFRVLAAVDFSDPRRCSGRTSGVRTGNSQFAADGKSG
jgi:hypothetical protein